MTLNDLTRGYEGTTPAAHPVNTPVVLMELVEDSPEVLAAFTGCARGVEGSTAASHAIGTAIESRAADMTLAQGEVLRVDTHLVADPSLDRSDKGWDVTVFAQDGAF